MAQARIPIISTAPAYLDFQVKSDDLADFHSWLIVFLDTTRV